jgi:hypothetical protein
MCFVNNLLAEGVFGRKSLSVGRHYVCFDASFCIRLPCIQKW